MTACVRGALCVCAFVLYFSDSFRVFVCVCVCVFGGVCVLKRTTPQIIAVRVKGTIAITASVGKKVSFWGYTHTQLSHDFSVTLFLFLFFDLPARTKLPINRHKNHYEIKTDWGKTQQTVHLFSCTYISAKRQQNFTPQRLIKTT